MNNMTNLFIIKKHHFTLYISIYGKYYWVKLPFLHINIQDIQNCLL